MIDDVAARVINSIWETTSVPVDKANAALDMSLRDDLGLKSMDAVAVVFALEKEFRILVDTSALTGINTIGDAVALVRRQLGKKSGPLP